MQLTREDLQRIIKEELGAVLQEEKEFPEKVHKKARYIQDKEGKDRDQAYAIAISMYEDGDLDEAKAYHWDEPDWEYGGGYGDGTLEEKKKKRKKKKKTKSKRKKAGTESSKESSLRDWFGRKGAKGKKGGWVDCNAPDGKGGYKSCGRASGEKRKKYPSCRPTPGACKERGKGKSWGKKAKRGKKG
jgi:hypothetical protein